MERKYSKNAAGLQRSFRFFNHHETVKSVICFLFSMKHICIDDKIKIIIVKIMTVIFSSDSCCNAIDLLVLRLSVYVIQTLLVDIHRIDFAFLFECKRCRKRIITCTTAIVENHRIIYIQDRRKDICTFLFLPFIYVVENTHCQLPINAFFFIDHRLSPLH